MKISVSLPLGLVLGASAIPIANDTGYFEQRCNAATESLSFLIQENATAKAPEFVVAGTNITFPGADATCGRSSQVASVDMCRIVLYMPTSERSGFNMEAWLPSNWTGRFLSTGNGGLGGCIQYEDLDYAASFGFAAVGTDNGHTGMGGTSFLNNLDVVEDFAYRAVHTGVVFGKQISEAFYKKSHSKSYYLGCSTGGRQGFKSVQDFPEDFDGVVAGAPAISFNNLTSWSSGFINITGSPESEMFVPLDMWPVIAQDILKQCDGIDKVMDNIIEDPALCDYKPDGLICSAAQNTSCLTPTQAETVRKTFSPLIDPDGSLVYPGMQPGSEETGAVQTLYTGQVIGSSDWFKYAILNDPNWDPATINPNDWHKSQDANLFNIQTWEGDLSAFQNRGSKLLHYHGLQDGVITSENSPRYYQHVSDTMGKTPDQLDEFYRFFRISGMGHCGGGTGASAIGNGINTFASEDPEENVLLAMVRWVEEGVPPEIIRGTAFVNGDKNSGVAYKRNHCRFPRRTTYQSGDPNDPTSWICV
ncbi:hypothetical protein V502_10959 [Pseudogymnoascus sp. VKM F-4520 (FW-2644)]|nr:hypothetical protein V502_10959 [Pseudogymnoascus sp. VKM F-4520 (FW-2644)]